MSSLPNRARSLRAKIIFLVSEDWYFVSHRLDLARSAVDMGFDVVVATRPGRHRDLIEAAGIRLVPMEISRGIESPLAEISGILRIWRLYRHERPDIVHHVALKPILLGGVAARLAGISRVVAAVAGLGFLFSAGGRAPVLARLLRRLMPILVGRGRAIVQNPDDAAVLTAWGVPDGQVRLIRGAGVDTQRYTPRPEAGGIPLVLLPARLLWDKGVGEFIEAARRIRAAGLPARFVLAGAPDLANPASVSEATVKAWVEEGVVEWWGHRDDMPETLGASAIVCLPSYREGLPKSLLEAAACGRPIVTTDVPGCREVVLDGDNGYLVPARDVPSLVLALTRLIGDPEQRRLMGERGRLRAETEFSQQRVCAETLAVYRELLS
ncbi:MAG: glycosyltransferase family 4 protein [Pseudomonadota bacterium]